jgi:predicted N-acyltransferase
LFPVLTLVFVQLQKEKVTSLSITMPPDGYDFETGFLLAKILQNHGFQLGFQDLNFHLDVNSDFKKHLHRSERWKLNKSIRAEYIFHKVEKPDWDLAFRLLNESRERKGFRLSMDQKSLEEAFNIFPDRYQLFAVVKEEETVAIAITLKINKEILYIFYTADLLKHRKLSPVVLLHNGIYQFCQSERIQLLDLGTSSLKGQVNSGVANFKRNLGGIASLKNTFVKRF